MGKLYSVLVALSLIWGTSFLFIKLAVGELGPWGVAFWRCFFGTVILFLVLAIKKEKVRWKQLPWKQIAIVAFFNNALPWGLIAMSEMKISSSLASVVNATTPIWTIFIGFLLFSQRLRVMQWIGVLVGFAGIILLMDLDFHNILSESHTGTGTMIAAAMCYGLGAHLSKKYLKDLSVTIISATTLLSAAVLSFFPMMIFDYGKISGIAGMEVLMSMLGLGIIGSGLAYLLYYYMVMEGGAEFASLVTYLVPVSALVWGRLLLNETISASMIGGLLLIFSGVYLSSLKIGGSDTGKRKAAV